MLILRERLVLHFTVCLERAIRLRFRFDLFLLDLVVLLDAFRPRLRRLFVANYLCEAPLMAQFLLREAVRLLLSQANFLLLLLVWLRLLLNFLLYALYDLLDRLRLREEDLFVCNEFRLLLFAA